MKLILARPNLISWEDAYKTRPPWDIGRPQPAFVELVQAGELNKGRVLDVGCGTGENALYLAEREFSVIGVDLSTRAIDVAKTKGSERKLKVDFRLANALSLDFKNDYLIALLILDYSTPSMTMTDSSSRVKSPES